MIAMLLWLCVQLTKFGETFGLFECNGDKNVLKRLNALIVRPNHPQVIGVMLDADSALTCTPA